MTAPVLVIAVGNQSRGDDGLAPLLLHQLQSGDNGHVECIEDYQLQVEHVTDMLDRSAVLFIDADVSCAEPFHFSEITAERDDSYTSHMMTPFALLHTYRLVYGTDAPPAFLLRIRGYDFELGHPLSEKAAANLVAAMERVRVWCAVINLPR